MMQEISGECFVIGRDSNWGFRALGWLQDVNTAGVDVGGCCVPGSLTVWALKLNFVNFTQHFEVVFISARESVISFVLLVEIEMLSLQGVFMAVFLGFFLFIKWGKWMGEEKGCSCSFLNVGIPTIFFSFLTRCVSGEKEVSVFK